MEALPVKPRKIVSLGVVDVTLSGRRPGQPPNVRVRLDDSVPRAAQHLRRMVHTTASVRRAGADFVDIPLDRVVPGDVVRLSAGDMIPGDLRLLEAKDLFVNQSALSGEAMPVEKSAAPSTPPGGAFDLPNVCFMGTNVVSGTAVGVVAATGDATQFGAMARDIVGARPLTSFDKGITRVSSDNLSTSRLGFKGTEDIGGGLKAGFWLESEINTDTGVAGAASGGAFWARRATVSLTGDFGEVRLGRNKTVDGALDAARRSTIVTVLPEILDGKLQIAKVNIDDHDSIATEHGVRAIPTMILFKQGKVAETLVGMMPKAALKEKLAAKL